jgi:hypothetical protein
MLANFREGFSSDCGVKMKPAKFRRFCDLERPTYDAGWPEEGALDLAIIARIRNLIMGDPVILTSSPT